MSDAFFRLGIEGGVGTVRLANGFEPELALPKSEPPVEG
jgi:hypothetical protein